MFWVNDIVSDILKRKDSKYLVTDYKTPSGKVHVGALRGVVIHEVLYQGLLDQKKPTEYWYGFDDFDPMDGLSKELEKDFKKYMGMPLCNIPSPDSKAKSFARFYGQEFENVYRQLGVKSKTVWASEFYRAGKYDKAIKLVLDNAEEIRDIYYQISGSKKPKDWYAFQVVCPNCRKIGTTRVFDWDSKLVSFKCEPKMVDWAQGCGYQGKISPFKGNGKMPYKVETAAKWFSFGTSVELAGKDHYTKGGSFDVARQIAQKIFKIKPAFGFGYEWFLASGKKMSTSKGVGTFATDIAKILPAELLRFLMVRTRAKRAIDFDLDDATMVDLFDEYDRCIDAYLKDPQSDLAQAYYYTKITNSKPLKYRLRFSKAAYLLQMPRVDIVDYTNEEKGSKLTKEEADDIKLRVEFANIWLDSYAPENFKFHIQDKVPELAKKLSIDQKKFLLAINNLLERKKWTGEELHQEIHQIKKEQNMDARAAFSAIYLSLLGKDSGPQAGWLIASLDTDFVINRFKEVG